MLTMLGIPNCDTIKKAKKHLQQREVPFEFRDLRKQPLSIEEWRVLVEQDREDKIVNTRGPSFRKLGVDKAELDGDKKVEVLNTQPTTMKRPVMLRDNQLLSIGFSEEVFNQLS